jgi:hypothetical protein
LKNINVAFDFIPIPSFEKNTFKFLDKFSTEILTDFQKTNKKQLNIASKKNLNLFGEILTEVIGKPLFDSLLNTFASINTLKNKFSNKDFELTITSSNEDEYGKIVIYIKNISSSSGFDIDNIVDKFRTCLDDFISHRFAELLFIDYKSIQLYFVTNIDKNRANTSLAFEAFINKKFKYNGKTYLISPRMPQPTIKKGY